MSAIRIREEDFLVAKHLNPMQSQVAPYIKVDCNLVVSAPTASGKTQVAEMIMSKALLEEKKCVYLAPMKALSEERYNDFTEKGHPFSELSITVMTGDYEMTAAKKKEVRKADLIIMTTEMLNTRCRMVKSEQNNWLGNVGVLVVDESHLLSVSGRGDAVEAGLMLFTKINPASRVILLSATMPNAEDMGKWLYVLNGKPTKVIKSDYRPCKLESHYMKVLHKQQYSEQQHERMVSALSIIEEHPKDKFLVFSGTKNWGRQFEHFLLEKGYDCAFHNADLDRSERKGLEKAFKKDDGLKILISTTTTSWGVNLPARRVIVAHQSFGIEPMPVCDIIQMMGRSGRPKYDTQGDAYVLIDEKEFDSWVQRIEDGEDVRSLLGQRDVLEFHSLAEITNGSIDSEASFLTWYSRSLAAVQCIMPASPKEVLDSLRRYRCILPDVATVKVTALGKISAWLYYPPRVVARWKDNMKLFSRFVKGKGEECTLRYYGVNKVVRLMDVALALICTQGINLDSYIPKNERTEVDAFWKLADSAIMTKLQGVKRLSCDGTMRDGLAFLLHINGTEAKGGLKMVQRYIASDAGRVITVLKLIDKMVLYGNMDSELAALELRIKYGVREELLELVSIKGVGKVRASRLFKESITTRVDIIENEDISRDILGKSLFERIKEIMGGVY